MRIVHIVPSFARGGGERLVIELANRQAAAGHDVHVIVGHRLPDELTHILPDPDVRVTFLSPRPLARTQRYLAGLRWLARNRSWLIQQDILHAHLTYGAVLASIFRIFTRTAPESRRPAIIETYHAVGMPISSFVRWFHARMAVRHDALVLMVDDPWWSSLAARHPRLTKAVIPAGVFDRPVVKTGQQKRRYRANLGVPEDALVVGTIGRMAPERQTHRYARIMSRIAQCGDAQTHFLVGGDGPERARVEAAFAAAFPTEALRRVHFLGLVHDVEEAFSIMDLYITSNIRAVCGVAGLQAIGAGVPAIALQLRCDYAAGAEDWIWSSADEDEVAARACELLVSAEERSALRQRQARYLQQRHSAAAMALAYERLYEQAISRSRQPKAPDHPSGRAERCP